MYAYRWVNLLSRWVKLMHGEEASVALHRGAMIDKLNTNHTTTMGETHESTAGKKVMTSSLRQYVPDNLKYDMCQGIRARRGSGIVGLLGNDEEANDQNLRKTNDAASPGGA